MKKFQKNKKIVIPICIIFITIVYLIAQNLIFTDEKEENIIQESDVGKIIDANIVNQNIVKESNEKNESTEEELNQENESIEDEQVEKIFIYITGEVNNPGVIILDKGSRIIDAIDSAGGTTAAANISKVNLAFVLEDGMKIVIPNSNDLKENSDFEHIISGAENGNNSDSENEENKSENKIYKMSSVNINTATQTELETLPGIGPSLALNIINYRKENGKFLSVEDIKNVSGIGESKFDKIKEFICV